jgi:hypothetical protein
MTDKIVPFPAPAAEPEPSAKRQSRTIFYMGSHRFAVDTSTQITRLNPEPAPVLPLKKPEQPRRPRRPRK